MHKQQFDEEYVALSVGGASWLRDYSKVQVRSPDAMPAPPPPAQLQGRSLAGPPPHQHTPLFALVLTA
jgi:hypothetical protein